MTAYSRFTSAPTDHAGAGRRSPRAGARSLLILVIPTVVYFAVRPDVNSDTAALAIAGAVPLTYQIVLALWRRQIELLAVVTSLGYALACLASMLAGGSSLPLKLHEAGVTFALGLVLLGAVLVRRPLPIGRVLRVPDGDRQLDTSLSVLVGSFLVLHALLHVALAISLSTSSYLVAGRVLSLLTLAVGGLCLYAYLRHIRVDATRL